MRQLELGWDSPEDGNDPGRRERADPAKAPENRESPDEREALEHTLAAHLERPVRLTLTQNRRTMVSSRTHRSSGLLELRVHEMFASAPPHTVAALAAWIAGSRSKQVTNRVDTYIRDHLPREPEIPAAPRRIVVRTQGAEHDLARLYAEVNAAHFDNAIDCPITWGNMPATRGRRRSIRLGSYAPDQHLIRIHPFLDQDFVPAWFVAFIVFHEMLHAAMGIATGPSGRRQVHPPAFKARERAHPDFARAEAWLADPKNLRRLLGPGARGMRAWMD